MSTTTSNDIKLLIKCRHCDNQLSMTHDFMDLHWDCEEHGRIYGFYGSELYETEHSKSLYEKNLGNKTE